MERFAAAVCLSYEKSKVRSVDFRMNPYAIS